jgi:hypothetical protein
MVVGYEVEVESGDGEGGAESVGGREYSTVQCSTYLIESNSEKSFSSLCTTQDSHYTVCDDVKNLYACQRAEDLCGGDGVEAR